MNKRMKSVEQTYGCFVVGWIFGMDWFFCVWIENELSIYSNLIFTWMSMNVAFCCIFLHFSWHFTVK